MLYFVFLLSYEIALITAFDNNGFPTNFHLSIGLLFVSFAISLVYMIEEVVQMKQRYLEDEIMQKERTNMQKARKESAWKSCSEWVNFTGLLVWRVLIYFWKDPMNLVDFLVVIVQILVLETMWAKEANSLRLLGSVGTLLMLRKACDASGVQTHTTDAAHT